MWKDPIIEELNEFRRQLAERYNYDLEAMFEDLRRQQEAEGRQSVSLPPKVLSKKSNAA